MGDIRQPFLTFPELGNEEIKKKYDDFAKVLQNDLGRPPIGLKEFEPKAVNGGNAPQGAKQDEKTPATEDKN